MDADRRSPQYQKYVVDGLTKTLVACKARQISTRTGGGVGAQLLLDVFRGGTAHLLNGPTSDVWIEPWVRHLELMGVEFRFGASVKRLRLDAGRVAHAVIEQGGVQHELSADHYLLALPVEGVLPLLDEELTIADPRLAGLGKLRTAWMAGAQLYLDCELVLNHGHTVYFDSPWALTSVSQAQFWPNFRPSDHGSLRSVLSVCISDWDSPGIVFGKTARECSRDEIRRELWAQLRNHWPAEVRSAVTERNILGFQLDPAITFGPDGVGNEEPLLINTVGSWEHRPEATTAIENLFLAADYVRTYTDLATMEGANEAARRATNGILERAGVTADACAIWPLSEPAWLAPLKAYDRLRWASGLPAQPIAIDQMGSVASRVFNAGAEAFRGVVGAVGDELLRRGADRQIANLDWRARSLWSAFRDAVNVESTTGERSALGVPPAAAGHRPSGSAFTESVIHLAIKDDADPRIQALGAALVSGIMKLEDELRSDRTEDEARVVERSVAHILRKPGKHLRALCVLVCASIGRRLYAEEALHLAVVVELVHAATLLHDDVIDMGERRRGAPTARLLHGELASVLGGDLLMLRASRSLLALGRPDLFRDLVRTMETIVDAESEQLENRGRLLLDEAEYLKVIHGKTAVLFGWACAVGGVAAGRPSVEVAALRAFGEQFGIAFQITDDLLDVSGNPEITGKSLFADLREGKATYPLIAAARSDPDTARRLANMGQGHSDLARPEIQAELAAIVTRPECLADTRARALHFAEAAMRELGILAPGPACSLLRALVRASIDRDC